MTETVSKFFAQVTPPHIGVSEAFLLASSVFLSGSIVAALHHWMDVSVPAAILSVVGCLFALVAGNALMRRTATVSVVDAEIAELRAEIAVLRSGRSSSPLGSADSVPVGSPSEQLRRTASNGPRTAIMTPVADERPTALLPAPSAATPAARRVVSSEASGDVRPVADGAAYAVGRNAARHAGSASQPSSHPDPGRTGVREPLRHPIRSVTEDVGGQLSRLGEGQAPTPRQTAFPASASPIACATADAPASPSKLKFGGRSTMRMEPVSPGQGEATDLEAMQALIDELAAHRSTVMVSRREQHRQPASRVRESVATTAISLAAEHSGALARKTSGNGPDAVAARGLHRSAEPENSGEVALFGHVTLISEALEAKRMEAFLDPLVALGDRKLRHLELSARLVTQSGHAYAEDELHRIAPGTGLLARFDAAKLAHAVGVLNRFRTNGSRACLFSAVAGESLVDDNFAGAASDILVLEPCDDVRLVLVFAQAEARNFSTAHWHAVTQIWKLGVTFALAEVTDLDMDFELLKAHGFDFIKLDAAVFLEGLPTAAGHVPAADICRHLAGLGLSLILGGGVAE